MSIGSLNSRPADPVAKGVVATVKQAWRDLWIWEQRVIIQDGRGECEWMPPDRLQNPFRLFGLLSVRDWLYFIVGFLAWTADAFDFHALSVQTTKLAQFYNTNNTAITTAITLTLLLRSLGAAIFGIAGDKMGRKWPMVINLFVLGILQIGSTYCQTLVQLIGVRALFGIFMGGIYGNAIAMALENCPMKARGLMSGILQQGYAFGYVLAACANLAVGGEPATFKIVFWIGAGFCFLVGLLRIFFAESRLFLIAKAQPRASRSLSVAWSNTKSLLAKEYKLCLYCTILMAWFNFYSHTSQDSYTTFMIEVKGLDNAAASRTSIWMKVGACVGGTVMGYISQFFGRRRTILVSVLVSTLMIPGWILPHSEAVLSFTGFLMQFFVQGAWGVIPIHLNELAPTAYRSSFAGITYQLGNMISSPSTQIVNVIAESRCHRQTPSQLISSSCIPDYGPVMGIATAIIAIGIFATVVVGPERKGRNFEAEASATLDGVTVVELEKTTESKDSKDA